jgi:hypothetical protein
VDLLDIRWVPFVWAIIIVLISIIGYAPFLPLLLLGLTKPVRIIQNLAINNRHHIKRTEYHLASKVRPHTSPSRTYDSLIDTYAQYRLYNEIRYRSAHSLIRRRNRITCQCITSLRDSIMDRYLRATSSVVYQTQRTHGKKNPPCAEDYGPTKACTTRKSNHPHITLVRSVGETM